MVQILHDCGHIVGILSAALGYAQMLLNGKNQRDTGTELAADIRVAC